MTSINSNLGAMVALQNLRSVNDRMENIQEQIGTGKKINSAKDNAAVWSMATKVNSENSMLGAIGEGLAMSSATVSMARQGAESIGELLTQVKDKVVQAQSQTADRTQLKTEITELFKQITSVMESASFNGKNLLEGTAEFKTVSSISRSSDTTPATTVKTIDVTAQDLKTKLDVAKINFTDDTKTAETLGEIDTMMEATTKAASALGTAENRLETQSNFLTKLIDIKEAAVSSLVDADMTALSAEMTQTQTQQQLAVQALSIAGRAPQTLLSLFR
ncbi:flagellin [Limimaricola soesokkakensis]|uniref:Flagellin n=1 Tax=Limimaricola soesokkakensis TaxID=1343159 RepID=A0A1X7A0U9_9RHOB|nr:flagellin [Limimaricola soesokkakensis]PSK81569.1 flagellin [Limimaricola soesokkakensis]SLN67329.1 Flagellin [Limimaricola soesokkakensis]